jgi:RNA polymerase sigma-70 factor (ECF subfamily)
MSKTGQRPEERLDELWRAYAPAVVRYARRRVLPGEVDEVVAETFVVAWRRLDDVPEHALPWLLGVARGVSANVRRTARRRDALTDRLIAQVPGEETADLPGDGGLSAQVVAALEALRPEDRELLTLLAWDGLTREEAARALDVSRATLAVRLHRVRRRMAALLADASVRSGPSNAPALLPQTGQP